MEIVNTMTFLLGCGEDYAQAGLAYVLAEHGRVKPAGDVG